MGRWRLTCVSDVDSGYLDEAWLLVGLLNGIEDLQCSFVVNGLCTSVITLLDALIGQLIQEGRY